METDVCEDCGTEHPVVAFSVSPVDSKIICFNCKERHVYYYGIIREDKYENAVLCNTRRM